MLCPKTENPKQSDHQTHLTLQISEEAGASLEQRKAFKQTHCPRRFLLTIRSQSTVESKTLKWHI